MSDINRLLCNAKTAAEVRKYLAQGADIDNTSGPLWGTPLICASRSGYFEVVQALIQAGANLTRKDHANRSALDVARERGYMSIVQLLRSSRISEKDRFSKYVSHPNASFSKKREGDGLASIGDLMSIQKSSQEERERKQLAKKRQKQEQIKQQIQTLLQQNKFIEAEKMYSSEDAGEDFDFYMYRNRALANYFQREGVRELTDILEDLDGDSFAKMWGIFPHFIAGNFHQADEIYLQSSSSLREQIENPYLEAKTWFVSKFFENKNINCSPEQALAIAHPCQNLLIEARAGSGKTTTLVNKCIFEIQENKLSADNIRILAFNVDAAGELNTRLTKAKVIGKKQKIASTFHSLAHDICSRLSHIPLNILDSESAKPDKDSILHDIAQKFLDNLPRRQELYKGVRNSCFEIDQKKYGLLLVKKTEMPLPQKYMADFLFENLVQYRQETCTAVWSNQYMGYSKMKKRPFFADMALAFPHGKAFIRYIESSKDSVQDEFKSEENILLEFSSPYAESLLDANTSPEQIPDLAAKFKDNFRCFLEENKILCLGEKPEEERLTEFFKHYKNDFITFAGGIINQYQKKQWDFPTIEDKIKSFEDTFPNQPYLGVLKLSVPVYQAYVDYLNDNNCTDYNVLLADATQHIESLINQDNLCSAQIQLREEICKWELLCIDEYQDFSELFFHLIDAIKAVNPHLRIMCVGDDWQAINGFAGSKIDYFDHFEQWIQDAWQQPAARVALRINRRSTEEILKLSNFFMTGDENSARGAKGTGKSQKQDPRYMGLKFFNMEVLQQICLEKNAGKLVWADALFQIMQKNRDKSFLVLARKKDLFKYLKEYFPAFVDTVQAHFKTSDIVLTDDNLRFLTAHGSKGLESDIVVVLTDTNSFPLFHPTREIMQNLFDIPCSREEQNLFYVAMTRAREQIYFVGEEFSFNQNSFLQRIKGRIVQEPYKGIQMISQPQVQIRFSNNPLRNLNRK